MKLVVSALVGLVVLALLVTLVAAGLFSRRLAALEGGLAATPVGAMRDDLPERVAEFAMRGMAGGALAGAATLDQACEMRLARGADWQPLAARQVIAASTPGFAWVAVQRRGPLPVVRVLDSYADGLGLLDIRLFGAFRLGAEQGPQAALGEGLRYLAELPWSPDAILSNRAVTWAESGARVSAQMQTAGGLAVVFFSFDAAGDIVAMMSPGRPVTEPDGRQVLREWRGTMSDYREIGGRRIALRGEVGYVHEDGYEAYWRGEITRYSVVASVAN